MNDGVDRQLLYAQAVKARADEGPPYALGEFAAAVVREIHDAVVEEDHPIHREQRLARIVQSVRSDAEVAHLCSVMRDTPAIEHCHEQMASAAKDGSALQPSARIPVAFMPRNAKPLPRLPNYLAVVDCLELPDRVELATLLIVVDVLDVQHRSAQGAVG